MDIKTAMALRNYGVSPLTKNLARTPDDPAASFGQSLMQGGGAAESTGNTGGPADFASVMKSMLTESAGAVKGAEKTAMDGINNKADTQSVVDAMANAEMTVRTAVAVRDKVVEAYQEILRMSI